MPRRVTAAVWLAAVLTLCVSVAGRQHSGERLDTNLKGRIDSAVKELVAETSVPSAVVGIVQNGRIVYTAAFGSARLSPRLAATTAMRYPIGSISKQFTAACVLLLVQEGKLSLEDRVGRYFPELTRSADVTIRNLLSHTSGYRDYAPQDYTIPAWTKPTTPDAIVHEWGTLPLDFEPGTQYQYSNTNYNIAGLIVEKASGERFWPFLQARVLDPLGLSRTIDLDRQRSQVEPAGYFRYALGPLRPASLEAPGWYFADASMAMPIDDLLTWDISLMNRSLLQPASYAAMETEVTLKNGQGVRYGLGVSLTMRDGHRLVSHGGEVGGFVSSNSVFPDDKLAIAVLTNQEASAAAGRIGRALSAMLLPAAPTVGGETSAAERQAQEILLGLQHGKIDRTLFTDNANYFFSDTALADHRSSLSPLGAVSSVRQTSTSQRGGMTFRAFEVQFAKGTKLLLSTFTTTDGKLEQFLLDVAG